MDGLKSYRQTGAVEKTPTGIRDFDRITEGGLPRNQTTLVIGGPGCGKTVFALQVLANGIREHGEPGIFVAFEESSRRLISNAESFGWGLEEQGELFFIDACLAGDTAIGGRFELAGLLANIKARADEMGATRIVFDSVDVLLTLLNDPIIERREVYALRDWLSHHKLTGIITTRIDESDPLLSNRYGFMQFMADCVIQLHHNIVDQVSVRHMNIVKYRGSDFVDAEFPLVIGRNGIEVLSITFQGNHASVSTDRVSTGIERLDAMFTGGYLRGTSILITGAPGTAKSSLAASFADAACKREEKTLFATFDTRTEVMVRDMKSVNIDLTPHIESGMLKVYSRVSQFIGPEKYLCILKELIEDFRPSCIAIDPISAMIKSGGRLTAENTFLQLLSLTQSNGITLVCTSLMEGDDPLTEKSAVRISTIADTWIHVSFFPMAGERNRALTIIKSRGTGHSNQVRELLLSCRGITVADVYTEEGEVLMGTMRRQKEQSETRKREALLAEMEERRHRLEQAEQQTLSRIEALRQELEEQRSAIRMLKAGEEEQKEQWVRMPEYTGKLRGRDQVS